MIGRAIELVKQLITDPSSYQDLSKRVNDEKLIQKFTSDPDFPFFVSFHIKKLGIDIKFCRKWDLTLTKEYIIEYEYLDLPIYLS